MKLYHTQVITVSWHILLILDALIWLPIWGTPSGSHSRAPNLAANLGPPIWAPNWCSSFGRLFGALHLYCQSGRQSAAPKLGSPIWAPIWGTTTTSHWTSVQTEGLSAKHLYIIELTIVVKLYMLILHLPNFHNHTLYIDKITFSDKILCKTCAVS